VILPRPLYDEDLRRDLRKLLVERYGVTYVDNRTSFLDDEVALIHFFCNNAGDVDLGMLAELENDIKDCATPWEDRFEAALLERYSSEQGYRLAEEYRSAFPKEYRIVTFADDAALDVECLERLRQGDSKVELALSAESGEGEAGSRTSWLKVYQAERPYLTDLLPLLDNFGLRVIDAMLTQVSSDSGCRLWIVTFRMEDLPRGAPSRAGLETGMLEGLRAALSGRVESDPLNRLVLGAGLNWQEVELIRAYLAYARQLGGSPERRFVSNVLIKHTAAICALLALFRARFDPDLGKDREAREAGALAELASQRESIPTADEDRVFALLTDLILSTLRTNFFAKAPEELQEVAFKFDSKRIKTMPSPKPYAEIFVHSAEMTGVHLRGGPIARGGIRWSDRIQDLRTEVLGLMKTQMTKNGLIVPSGAKGGFILKRCTSGASTARQVADRQYARFVEALLGITDNVIGDDVVGPERVVRHDQDDPYLVVAADKGTAHLSDVANRVACACGFWLGDAFASGGSDGYDHKKEGITARGAWVCVKRHFLELGIDAENEPFTLAGIGDMSGDVFGNALLLAHKSRLLAAFNHLHIFLDPDPDPELAWAERRRLFELPRSTWRDYDTEKISQGGGVYDRAARAIPLTPEVKTILDVDTNVLSGEEMIRTILRMPVDLLWNGGVGTYIKASRESEAEVGDRANASVRVDACEVRARVIGEGGNLGLTQLARVEYALGGGRLNTDAIDNSGGVDLSDHEVNFKILLAPRCRAARIALKDRNELLRDCVAGADASVLAHNASQARCLSLDLLRSAGDPERTLLAAQFLEQHADLEPHLEFLPTREELRSRASASGMLSGHTRPELAILLGYTKMLVKRELVRSKAPDHPLLQDALIRYFPESLRVAFREDIECHPLRREITATCLTNEVIDQAGITLVPELVRTLGTGVADVVVAYHTVGRLLSADRLRSILETEPLPEDERLQASLRIEGAVRTGAFIFMALERRAWLEPGEFSQWMSQVGALRELVASHPDDAESVAEPGHAHELSRELEWVSRVARGLGAISLSIHCDLPLPHVVDVYAAIGAETRADWLLERLRELDRHEPWDRLGAEALYLEVLEAQRALTERCLARGDTSRVLEEFRARKSAALQNIERTVQQIDAGKRIGLAPLTVLSQQLRRLC
jgi:glutamate dehydrogenase